MKNLATTRHLSFNPKPVVQRDQMYARCREIDERIKNINKYRLDRYRELEQSNRPKSYGGCFLGLPSFYSFAS